MAPITTCSDFGAEKDKVSHCFPCFPIYLPWSDGTRCHYLSFFMLNFKPNFPLSFSIDFEKPQIKDTCSLKGKLRQLDSILKSRDIPLPTKVHLIKAMVLPVVMYGYERWTVKKPECQIIDAFELWCWRRLLRVPWTARRSNQSILKDISLEYSLEGLMLKLKL